MVDIVEWLRKSNSEEWCGAMLDKAADEIEDLRKRVDRWEPKMPAQSALARSAQKILK